MIEINKERKGAKYYGKFMMLRYKKRSRSNKNIDLQNARKTVGQP